MVIFLVAVSGAAAAQATEEPTVSVVPGPTTEREFAPECNDVVLVFDEATSFVVERTGPTDDALTVTYEVDGSAMAGEHYEALPGAVDFEAGDATATVDIDVLTGPRTEMVELRLRLVDGSGYQPGVPAEATIPFVRPRHPSLPPPECGFFFAEGDRIARTVEVGATPERVVIEQFRPPIRSEAPPEDYRVALTGGALAPGLSLAEDGRFLGTAEEAGTYQSTIQACRTRAPGTCVTATLVILVEGSVTTPTAPTLPATSLPRTPQTLPATGAPGGPAVELGAVLVGLGLVLAGWARSARR